MSKKPPEGYLFIQYEALASSGSRIIFSPLLVDKQCHEEIMNAIKRWQERKPQHNVNRFNSQLIAIDVKSKEG